METKPNGGPAFPFPSGPEPREGSYHERCDGMSLRDYFAAQAMANIEINPVVNIGGNRVKLGFSTVDFTREQIAKAAAFSATFAYLVADAMLAERDRSEGE